MAEFSTNRFVLPRIEKIRREIQTSTLESYRLGCVSLDYLAQSAIDRGRTSLGLR